MTNPTPELNLRDFRTWLEENRNNPVGFPELPGCCPVANWLKYLTDSREADVTATQFRVGDKIQTLTPRNRTPLRFQLFIKALDNQYRYRKPVEVTGEEALEILDSLFGDPDHA